MKPHHHRSFSVLSSTFATALILLLGATPANAGCCQFATSCTDGLTKANCTAQGGRWSPCGICDFDTGTCKFGIRIPLNAPSCRMTASRSGPPAQIDVTVQSTGSGLEEIAILESKNVSVFVPSFVEGTTQPVVVTATKIDPNLLSQILLGVGDTAGNCNTCDPVFASVVRGKGRENKEESFTGVPAAEHIVTVTNGNPGLSSLEVNVNGTNFRLSKLQDGEVRTLDVANAMLSGSHNIFTLRSHGKLGSEAFVVIWDGINQ